MAAAKSKTHLATIMEIPRNESSPADSGTSMTDSSDWTSDSSEEEDDDCIIVGYRTIKSPPIQRNSQPKPKPKPKHRYQPYPKSKPQPSHARNAPLQYPSELLPQHIPPSPRLRPILDPPAVKTPWRANYPEPRAVDIWRPVQTTAGALTTYSTPRTEPVNHALSSNSYDSCVFPYLCFSSFPAPFSAPRPRSADGNRTSALHQRILGAYYPSMYGR